MSRNRRKAKHELFENRCQNILPNPRLVKVYPTLVRFLASGLRNLTNPTHDPPWPGPSDDDRINLNVWGRPFPTTPCSISAYLILLGGNQYGWHQFGGLIRMRTSLRWGWHRFDSHLELLKVMYELQSLFTKVFVPLLFDFSFLCSFEKGTICQNSFTRYVRRIKKGPVNSSGALVFKF